MLKPLGNSGPQPVVIKHFTVSGPYVTPTTTSGSAS